MKKAFTLVELLVVVVVIITLMAITFRLAGVASESQARNITIERMQRIENCLSGYYAAFGSYPPVDLHAKRNVYLVADEITGDQNDTVVDQLEWKNVRAACRAQPFSARFPFAANRRSYVDAISRIVVQHVNSSEDRYKKFRDRSKDLGGGFNALENPNGLTGYNTEASWQKIKIFQFGVMSFLMPRYLFMLAGVDLNDLDECAQWKASNRLSADPNNGVTFPSWDRQCEKKSKIRRIPSQAVCARWMPNFEGIVNCSGYPEFFGIRVSNGGDPLSSEDPNIEVFSSGSARYVLDCMTVHDGWGQEFFYYSPAPFQSYRLWSAGADGKTFPPWISLDSNEIKSEGDRRTAAGWMADDVMFMSN